MKRPTTLDKATRESMRRRIYNFTASKGRQGATCDENEVALDMRHQSVSSIMCSMKKGKPYIRHGTIMKRGKFQEMYRPTRSRRNAGVWVAMDRRP